MGKFQKLSYCSTQFHKPVLTENFFVSFLHYKILKTLHTLTEIYNRSTYITSFFHPSSATKVELDFHCNGQVLIVFKQKYIQTIIEPVDRRDIKRLVIFMLKTESCSHFEAHEQVN